MWARRRCRLLCERMLDEAKKKFWQICYAQDNINNFSWLRNYYYYYRYHYSCIYVCIYHACKKIKKKKVWILCFVSFSLSFFFFFLFYFDSTTRVYIYLFGIRTRAERNAWRLSSGALIINEKKVKYNNIIIQFCMESKQDDNTLEI